MIEDDKCDKAQMKHVRYGKIQKRECNSEDNHIVIRDVCNLFDKRVIEFKNSEQKAASRKPTVFQVLWVKEGSYICLFFVVVGISAVCFPLYLRVFFVEQI